MCSVEYQMESRVVSDPFPSNPLKRRACDDLNIMSGARSEPLSTGHHHGARSEPSLTERPYWTKRQSCEGMDSNATSVNANIPSKMSATIVHSFPESKKRSSHDDSISLSSPYYKKARLMIPSFKTEKLNFNFNAKPYYSSQEVSVLFEYMKKIHRSELEEQYETFTTFVHDFLEASMTQTASYIN